MTGQWIVRVQDREYGPVGVEELREWKREGRLIRENEVREPDSERWFPAGELPEIFADELDRAPAAIADERVVRRLSLGEIFAISWQLYCKGFTRFFAFAALVAVPAAVLQLAVPFLESPKPGESMAPMIVSAAIVFLMLVLLIIGWPFSLAGMQLLAANLFTGSNPNLKELFARAKPLWTRMLGLGFVVYGSYFLWTAIPALAALSLLAGGAVSLGMIFLSLALLIFTTYMVARLFINFLFWQQAGALGNADTMEALRESKDLARSGRRLPWTQRPLYRGAFIASLWLLVIIGLNFAISLPLILSKWQEVWKLQDVANIDQAMTIAQSVSPTHSLDFLTCLTTLLSSLAQAVLRPWLAAIFVVLYLDTKRTRERQPND
jgi:hypothetical protein